MSIASFNLLSEFARCLVYYQAQSEWDEEDPRTAALQQLGLSRATLSVLKARGTFLNSRQWEPGSQTPMMSPGDLTRITLRQSAPPIMTTRLNDLHLMTSRHSAHRQLKLTTSRSSPHCSSLHGARTTDKTSYRSNYPPNLDDITSMRRGITNATLNYVVNTQFSQGSSLAFDSSSAHSPVSSAASSGRSPSQASRLLPKNFDALFLGVR